MGFFSMGNMAFKKKVKGEKSYFCELYSLNKSTTSNRKKRK